MISASVRIEEAGAILLINSSKGNIDRASRLPFEDHIKSYLLELNLKICRLPYVQTTAPTRSATQMSGKHVNCEVGLGRFGRIPQVAIKGLTCRADTKHWELARGQKQPVQAATDAHMRTGIK